MVILNFVCFFLGADTVSMNNSIITHLSRDTISDNPAIVIYSLIGNDVCSGSVIINFKFL